MHPEFVQPLIARSCLIKKTDLKLFCFEIFNIAAFQESFEVKGGELKTIVGNDVFRIIVVLTKSCYDY